ncbi:hypothetical protein CCP3SC1_390027 [Gammaproteobacteria bacterium]
MKRILLGIVAMFGLIDVVNAVTPDLTPRLGAWTFYFYQGPGFGMVATKSICLQQDHTWATGPTLPGHGSWAQDGKDINFSGTIGEVIQGVAFSAFGHMLTKTMITGQYMNFNIVQDPPNGVYGSFRATFTASTC